MLERYRYTIARGRRSLLLLLPRVPGIGQQVNGAYLGVGSGRSPFQPAEFAKIAIVVFLAAYLRDTRQVLVHGARRVLGITFPPLKHFGPLLVVWGAAMVMLVFIRDLGSSLMFFGGFLALLYVATNRLSFVVDRAGAVRASAPGSSPPRSRPRPGPRRHLAATRSTRSCVERAAATRSRSRCSRRPTAGCSAPASARRCCTQPERRRRCCRPPHTDLIYAVIVNELGLAGACGLLLVYLLLAERGFKIAMLARDSFSKLLAAGLTAVFALQVFVIVGGVTRVIPLTGVTLPFVSYGGSSIVANFVLLALLLLVSDRARRPAARCDERADRPPLRPRRRAVRACSSCFTSRWTRVRGRGAARQRRTTGARCWRGSGSSAA